MLKVEIQRYLEDGLGHRVALNDAYFLFNSVELNVWLWTGYKRGQCQVESVPLDGKYLQAETMDAPKQLPDQDRADRQPSDVPTPSDEAHPKVFSDSEPPTVRYVGWLALYSG